MMEKKHRDESGRSDVCIRIKLLPRSSKNEVLGKEGDTYRVKVTAPPVDGKANIALIALLAKKLNRPKGDIQIIGGKKARIKRIRVHGLSGEDVDNLLDGS
ncbi:DUF167 domain-containing protein [Deltaproteobacteria bacterium]|nr:DUF167 domain-containing protein [Deltaproteobacteria bacterium]